DHHVGGSGRDRFDPVDDLELLVPGVSQHCGAHGIPLRSRVAPRPRCRRPTLVEHVLVRPPGARPRRRPLGPPPEIADLTVTARRSCPPFLPAVRSTPGSCRHSIGPPREIADLTVTARRSCPPFRPAVRSTPEIADLTVARRRP